MKEIKVKVMNRYIDGKSLLFINKFLEDKFWCKRISNDNGLVTDDPKASSVLHIDDELVVECEDKYAKTVIAFIGKENTGDEEDCPMTRDKALIRLRRLQKSGDTECAHIAADGILCRLLENLGFEDVVDEYYKVEKWYN
jgi:uncharacterized transporter YbjL